MPDTSRSRVRLLPLVLPVLLLLATACGGGEIPAEGKAKSASSDAAREALVKTIDSIVSAPITAGKVVGASIAVVKGSDTIAVQGFGRANYELNVPTPARATYEIGSVTKQFTGAAIMQLVEAGKLSLDDDVSKYVKFDLQGHKVNIRQLLNHTSGIKGYTEIPEFGEVVARRLPQDTLLRIVEKKPFDFDPGENETYNNTAFFLAGKVIEKVSGMSYEDYVQKNLFDKAGMKDAHYCSEVKIHMGKVTGYDSDSAGPVLKGALSHLWPYAAGSLCSSAIDLVAWNEALHQKGLILGPQAYQEFITPGHLNDSSRLGYAMGLAVYPRLGHRALHHGGGINGFLSENLYFPDDSLSVVVLFNTAGPGSPDEAAEAIAEAVLGKAPDASQKFTGDLARYAGTYTGTGRGRQSEIQISVRGDALMAKGGAPSDSARALTFLGDNTFARDYTRYVFQEKNGVVTGMRLDGGYGNNQLVKR